MMKKAEAEQGVRELCHRWADARGIPPAPKDQPSFADFCAWVETNPHSHHFTFRSTMPAMDEVERWFDEEFKQTWRN